MPSSKDRIPIDSDGNPNLKDWTDTSFCNNKPTWELQGITKGYLTSSTFVDADGEDRPILMLMAGIEINPNADYYQKWYWRFKSNPGSVIPQIQADINQGLNKYFKEPATSNSKKLGQLHATKGL